MVFFCKALVAIASLATLSFLPVAKGSPYIISDDRVRKLDITPVLGRGYSIMTDTYHSTCLMVEDTTPPSYNYDYKFYEFTSEAEREKSLSGSLSASFSYWGVKAAVSVAGSSTSKTSSKSHTVVAVMRLERYYSSVREEVSPLSDDAKTLLNSEDYVGFFKACGPNYVRGIRRAQEVSATFKFQSSSTETAKSFAAGLKVSGYGASVDAKFAASSKFSQVNSSLEIKILGFGLGLNEEGSDTLVATSLEEYNEVMKFAFKSFTQSKNSYAIGMVYGIEVVPWVNNASFQVESKILENDIVIPISRSLIPKADGGNCKLGHLVPDQIGLCCDEADKEEIDSKKYCQPKRKLDNALVKENMAANGEFVARLDSAMRYKLAALGTMEKCVTAANSFPESYNNNTLRPQDTVKYDKVIEPIYSLMHLKMAIDPLNDYGLIKHMAKEIDEYIEMFYSPCIAALFGMNVGDSSEVEGRYFSAYPWHTHDECSYLSCLATNMRWDRENGGCIPSLVIGPTAKAYSGTGNTAYCAQDVDSLDTTTCKYNENELQSYQNKSNDCWNGAGLNSFTIDYFMNNFCMPQLTSEKLDSTKAVTRPDDCDESKF